MKRALISLIVGAGLMATPVASFAGSAPLAPGGAAGVHKAESVAGVPVYALVGGVLVIVGIVAVAGSNGGGHVGTTTTGCDPSGNCTSPSSGST